MDKKEINSLRDHYNKSMDLAHEWGLNPYEIDFYIVPADKMYEIASYGVPGHFSHWTYGREYWKMKTSYDYGHSKIYELVINSNPAEAFLLENNSLLENQFVISHVIGHSHFFRENVYFSHTNRHVVNSIISTADRFREYELEYGRSTVESFIDDVLAIKSHIDPHLNTKKRDKDYISARRADKYDDLFPESMASLKEELLLEEKRKDKIPYEPERDLLKFISDYGRLRDWQRDVINSIREEMIYFLPQMQTKIINEGSASYIHRKMMHEIDPDSDPGGVEFSALHSGVLNDAPSLHVNPYWLGYNLLKRIEERWDSPSEYDKKELGMPGGEGWAKVLEVIELDNDQSFIRNYLDQEVCERLDLFSYGYKEKDKTWMIEDKQWEKVRDAMVMSVMDASVPDILVEDGDFEDSGQLFLRHQFDGRELHRKYAEKTLTAIQRLWGRPVLLQTEVGGKSTLISVGSDGKVRY